MMKTVTDSMGKYMCYQSPATAAPNIETLIEYLYSLEKASGPFVYRGQVKEWPDPLIPSLYRHSICKNRILTPKDSEYKYCLRHCGQRFIEMEPDSYIKRIGLEISGITPEEYLSAIKSGNKKLLRSIRKKWSITTEEYQDIQSLANNPEFASLLAVSGYEAALSKWIKPKHRSYILKRRHIWSRYLDELHRGMIRQFGFMQPFGFMLGLTLAQQYGFSSEFLDFTSNIMVAAFFSTHDAPYVKVK